MTAVVIVALVRRLREQGMLCVLESGEAELDACHKRQSMPQILYCQGDKWGEPDQAVGAGDVCEGNDSVFPRSYSLSFL